MNLKEFFGSRLGLCLIYGLLYFLSYELVGFEITMLIIGATILGNLDYNDKKNDKS